MVSDDRETKKGISRMSFLVPLVLCCSSVCPFFCLSSLSSFLPLTRSLAYAKAAELSVRHQASFASMVGCCLSSVQGG